MMIEAMAGREEYSIELFRVLQGQIAEMDRKLDKVADDLSSMKAHGKRLDDLTDDVDGLKINASRRAGIWLAVSGLTGAVGGFGGKTVLSWLGFVKP